MVVAEPAPSNRLPLHILSRSQASTSTHGPFSLRRHCAPRAIGSIKWRTSPGTAVMCAPRSLACEDGVMEAVERARPGSVHERSMTEHGDVVEAEVPY